MSMLEVTGLSKVFGTGPSATRAIAQLDFEVRENEFCSLVGPSGCGKTTLLKCVAGLLSPTTGHAALRGKRISGPPKDLAVVFQDYSRSLMPWLTVEKNVMLPLRRSVGAAERGSRTEEALNAVGLTGFAGHYPWQLSGGMQQRVAIARALAYRPRILLMDEPFASVDAQTRAELEDLVLRVRHEFGITVMLVTHDIDESVYMADRVIVLSSPPTYVQTVLAVDLPRPRDQLETKALPEFLRLRTEVYQQIVGHDRDRHIVSVGPPPA
jgi:NitT/TauT family transport system ATP-binding protein